MKNVRLRGLSIPVMFFMVVIMVFGNVVFASDVLMMATTTSTDNTGLLEYLAPKFQAATGIEWRWTATGTGKALEMGKNCDVDVLMVHAPDAEMQFVDQGFGIDRRGVMYNDFVIIGPESDPAGIKGKSNKEALTAVAGAQAVFVSRGDNSGTHKKELSLWKSAGLSVPEKESWYVQTGQGMLASINIAAERNGYTMSDRGTYIKYEDNMGGKPPLKIMVEGDAALLNPYSVIAVNPAKCAKVNNKAAEAFISWIVSPEAQKAIGEFKLLGKPLFTPDAK